MVRVLKDIGADILTLGPLDEPEPPFDYDGVDLLGAALLAGISSWFHQLDQEYWTTQPWRESFHDLLQLLRGCVHPINPHIITDFFQTKSRRTLATVLRLCLRDL
jgi:hypothetical protein